MTQPSLHNRTIERFQWVLLISGLLLFPFLEFWDRDNIRPFYIIPLTLFIGIEFFPLLKELWVKRKEEGSFFNTSVITKVFFNSDREKSFFLAAFLFVLTTCIVNAVWTIHTGLFHLKYSLIYIFLLGFIYAFHRFHKDRKTKFIDVFLKISLFLSIVHTGFIFLGGFNPQVNNSYFVTQNQLAFWGITTISLLHFFKIDTRVAKKFKHVSFLLLSFIVFFTFSRSGGVALVTFWLLYITQQKTFTLILLCTFVTSIAGITYYNTPTISKLQGVQMLHKRYFEGKDVKELNNFITGRGFDKVKNNPQLLLLGAGEGYPARFGDEFSIHNLFINVLFSYGLIGFIFFFIFFIKSFSHHLASIKLIIPIVIFAMFHDIAHNLYFWLLLLILFLNYKGFEYK